MKKKEIQTEVQLCGLQPHPSTPINKLPIQNRHSYQNEVLSIRGPHSKPSKVPDHCVQLTIHPHGTPINEDCTPRNVIIYNDIPIDNEVNKVEYLIIVLVSQCIHMVRQLTKIVRLKA